jgi:hypothetical protein
MPPRKSGCRPKKMKPKKTEIGLPTFVERNRIDLTKFRELAKLEPPMTDDEKKAIEAKVESALTGALSPEVLNLVHENVLEAKLAEIKGACEKLAAEKEKTAKAEKAAKKAAALAAKNIENQS